MGVILIIGADHHLLETRQWMLEAQGYQVLPITCVEQLASLQSPVSLLIFCHSASQEDRELALQIASVRWPDARSLDLVAIGAPTSHLQVDEVFDTVDGPDRLMSRIRQLVPAAASTVS